MNAKAIKQLLIYHVKCSPWMWVFPVVISFQPWLYTRKVHYNDLDAVTTGPFTSYLWMPLLTAVFLFCADALASKWTTAQTNQHASMYASEFLLTRPVDRSTLYWIRCLLYCLILLIPVLFWIMPTVLHPELEIRFTSSNPDTAEKLALYDEIFSSASVRFNESTRQTSLMAPRGAQQLIPWLVISWILLGIAFHFICMQLLRAPRHRRRTAFWILFILFFATQMLLLFKAQPLLEKVQIMVLRHSPWFLLACLPLAALSGWYGKKAYTRAELA